MMFHLNLKTSILLLLALVVICAQQQQVSAAKENIIIRFLDRFLLTVMHKLFNQPPANQNGTMPKYEQYAMTDESNEEIATANTQEIIIRSGYKYENHYVLSGDGYVTQLVRIVNPMADRRKLKQPPVMLFHGGIINPTAYIFASSIQHHPERYPQLPGDSHSSWNRSLAFVLANNGFDVWLVGTRGSSRQNQGHKKYRVFQPKGFLGKDEDSSRKLSLTDEFLELAETFQYWDYSYDEIAEFEMPAQVDRVLELTGAKNVTLFTFSCSTHVALAALSSNNGFSSKVHNLVLMAPILNYKGVNKFMTFLKNLMLAVEYKWGTFLTGGIFTTQPIRDTMLQLAKRRELRYTVVKAGVNFLAGSSAKFFTNLEAPVVGHIFEPVSFKMIQHMFQQVSVERVQKFDYGAEKNLQKYGTKDPPVRDISNLGVRRWALVVAENDNMAPSGSSQQLLDQVIINPDAIISYPQANHLDLVAGFECDFFINLPLLRWFNHHSLPPLKVRARIMPSYIEKQAQLEALVPGLTGDEPVNVVDTS